jgi:diguanylate cyclase (GGDEF)-like protein
MRWQMGGAREAMRSPIPWVALSATLALTAAGWFGIEHSRQEESRSQFERRTETAETAVRARMASYEQVLRSAVALIASDTNVSRREWHDFIGHLGLDERFPGIQAVGYAERVKPEGLAVHLRRVRSDGPSDYEVRPAGERADFFPIVFNEPSSVRNTKVLGFDMYSEPVRRAAMDRARDSADTAISGKLVLAGEAFRGATPEQSGFVMYVPVFRREARPLGPAARDLALEGFVFSPFRAQDMMGGVLDRGMLQVLDMQVFDEGELSATTLILDTRTLRGAPVDSAPLFSRSKRFQMPGRAWTLQFVSRPEFDAALAADRPWGVAAAGSVAALVLFLLTVSLVAAWNRAHELSMRDPLTGLYNRRYLEETIDRELPRARRLNQSVGVIVLDIDHFKLLNDTYGHDAGDIVLAKTGELLRSASRKGDIACRFGGEEFAIVLPGATLAIARNRAEDIRSTVEAMRFHSPRAEIHHPLLSPPAALRCRRTRRTGAAHARADRASTPPSSVGRNKVFAAVDD